MGRGTQERPSSGSGDVAGPAHAPDPRAHPPPRRTATLFILITVLLDLAALGVIFPALPKLVNTLHVHAAASTAEIIGFLAIAFAGMQFLASPIQGALSDRFGRRPIILASNFGLGIDYLIMALAPNFPWLFIGRLISGVAAGSTSAAYAYVADVSTPEERATRIRLPAGRLRARLRDRAGDRRFPGRFRRCARAVLGRGRAQPGQRRYRRLHPAGVAAEGPSPTAAA